MDDIKDICPKDVNITCSHTMAEMEYSKTVMLIKRDGWSELLNLVRFFRSCGFIADSRWDDDADYSYQNHGNWYVDNLKASKDCHRHLSFYVNVGCQCSHDCCGCLCNWRLEVEMSYEFFIITINRGFNY